MSDSMTDFLAGLLGEQTIEPYADRILVRSLTAEPVTPNGLYVPETVRLEPPMGIVVAVGPCLEPDRLEPGEQTVRPGDRIIYDREGARELTLDGQRLDLIGEYAVEGIFRRKEA